MELKRSDLTEAAQRGLISIEQAAALWGFLGERRPEVARFRTTHILYYLGGLIAIAAMSLFMTLGWEAFGGWGIFGIALAYGAAALGLTGYLLERKGLPIPAGILGALVVALTPLAIYGLQEGLGWWAEGRVYRDYHVLIDWRWLLMELATLAVGALMLWRYRLPFLFMPIAVTLWYLSMDLAPFLFGNEDLTWELRKRVSLVFGLLMILFALWVDLRDRTDKDFAFWVYLFGVMAFWGGLSLLRSDSELGKLFYLFINLGMIFTGALLSRRVFAVFGGLGVAGYLGHLAYDLFSNSLLFPFALSAVGLLVIYAGILWQRHEERLAQTVRQWLPGSLRALVERRG